MPTKEETKEVPNNRESQNLSMDIYINARTRKGTIQGISKGKIDEQIMKKIRKTLR